VAEVLLKKGTYLRIYERLLPELPEVLILLLAVASDINYRFGKLNRVALHYLTAGKGESGKRRGSITNVLPVRANPQ